LAALDAQLVGMAPGSRNAPPLVVRKAARTIALNALSAALVRMTRSVWRHAFAAGE